MDFSFWMLLACFSDPFCIFRKEYLMNSSFWIRSGQDRSGAARIGPERLESVRSGQDRSGAARIGPERPWSGQDRSGAARIGPERPGMVRSG